MTQHRYTTDDMIDFEIVADALRAAIKAAGSQHALALAARVSDAHVSMVLSRKRLPSELLLKHLGLGEYYVVGYYTTAAEAAQKAAS